MTAGAQATPAGARPTLPFRVELERQLRRRRTQITFGLLAALPVVLVAALAFGDEASAGASGLVDLASHSGANFTVFVLLMSSSFLLMVVVALFFGDAVASEAAWSSLRYLLTIPIPRTRLLVQKAVVAATLSAAGIVVLVAMALLVGSARFGLDTLVTPFGDSMPFGTAVSRIALAALYTAITLLWVAGLASLLSVWTDAPLGAVGGTVMVAILVEILDQITALGDLRDFLPGRFGWAWTRALTPVIDWHDMVLGTFSSLAYATVFATAAWWHFRRKDIVS
jgi:ABC-2 type transport system permease protein